MKADTRALAAKGLAEVALRGSSLREVMERTAPRLSDPRDIERRRLIDLVDPVGEKQARVRS